MIFNFENKISKLERFGNNKVLFLILCKLKKIEFKD